MVEKETCQNYAENYTFIESQPLSKTRDCLCNLPENQIDIYSTPMKIGISTDFSHSLQKKTDDFWLVIRQGKGTIRFSMRPLPTHVDSFYVYVGSFTFTISDNDINQEEEEVKVMKEELPDKKLFKKIHKQPMHKLVHFNATESHLWISLHATSEDLQFGQTYFIKVEKVIFFKLIFLGKYTCGKIESVS